jgi:hypothetical protein
MRTVYALYAVLAVSGCDKEGRTRATKGVVATPEPLDPGLAPARPAPSAAPPSIASVAAPATQTGEYSVEGNATRLVLRAEGPPVTVIDLKRHLPPKRFQGADSFDVYESLAIARQGDFDGDGRPDAVVTLVMGETRAGASGPDGEASLRVRQGEASHCKLPSEPCPLRFQTRKHSRQAG